MKRLQHSAFGLRLALRGIGYRRATAASVLVLAVVAATAAVVAPLYSRAAEESIARGALSRSDVFARAVHVDVSAEAARIAPDVEQATARVRAVLDDPAFGRPVTLFRSQALAEPTTGPQAGGRVEVPLHERSGLCPQLVVSAGRCPSAPDEVAVTTRSAALLGVRIGDRLPVALADVADAGGGQGTAELSVVGLFEPFDIADEYWVGREMFGFTPTSRPRGLSELPPTTDVGLTGAGTLRARGLSSYGIDVPVRPSRLDLTTGPQAAAMVEQLATELGPQGVAVTGQLPAVVSAAAARSRIVRIAAPLAAAQLVLLAWVILGHVVASATQERAPELGLAKLRGQTPGRTVRFGLAEVVVLLALAAPIGTLLGYLLVRLAVDRLLEPGVRVQVTGWALAAVLAGGVGGVASAAVAARGISRRHVADLLRRVPGQAAGRRAGAAEGMVLALVIVGIVQLVARRGDGPGPVAAAGPGMVALGAALLAARVLRLLAARRARRARERGRPAALLGWAGVARRSGVARTTGVLTAAVCLLLVGVQAWQVAARERTARAVAENGAAVVLDARAASARQLLSAVRAADPGGRYAMAAVLLDGRDRGPSAIAVDAQRADSVLAFGHGDHHGLGRALVPPLPAELVLRPGTVEVGLDVAAVSSPSPLTAAATVDVGGRWVDLPLGSLRPGPLTLKAQVPPSCAEGCRLVGLLFDHPGTDIAAATATFTLTRLTAGPASRDELPTDFERPGSWRPGTPDDGGAVVQLRAGPALQVELRTPGGVPARVVHGSSPEPLPGLVAAGTARKDGAVAAVALDGSGVRVDPVQSAAFVPRLGRSGAVVDLGLAAAATPAGTAVEGQVWLARDDADAERDLRRTLTAAGVQTSGRASAAGAAAVLARSGAVLALLLFLACGAVAVVVAAGALLVAAFVGARQRSAESAALRLVGVRSGTVLKGLLVENLAAVGVACVAGALGALVASWAVLPVLPMFDEPSSMLDVRTTPDPAIGAVSLLAVAAGLGALAAAVALVQARRGTVGRLGEGR